MVQVWKPRAWQNNFLRCPNQTTRAEMELNDEKIKVSVTIRESHFVAMVLFSLMTKKESKLSSTIIANSGVHTITDCKITKTSFNKNNVGTNKNINCCKMQIVFTNKTRLGNKFYFKDRIPKNFTTGVVQWYSQKRD